MARQEKSLAICLEILQDYTAKDFSLFAVLTTADFYSHNSQFHFYCTIQTTWNSDTPPFHVLVVRHEEKCFFLSVAGKPIKRNTIPWFAVPFCLHTPPQERSHWCKPQDHFYAWLHSLGENPMQEAWTSHSLLSSEFLWWMCHSCMRFPFFKTFVRRSCIHFSEMSMR